MSSDFMTNLLSLMIETDKINQKTKKEKRDAYYAKNRDVINARRRARREEKKIEEEKRQKEESDRMQMIWDFENDHCRCNVVSMPPCSFCENQTEDPDEA